MRFVGGMVLAVALLGVASAQSPPKAPAQGQQDPIAASYASMPEAVRKSIQTDLIWSGDYVGSVDGEIGPRAVEAVRAFQKRNRTKQTGVLNPQERQRLAAAARKARATVGWRIVDDKVSQTRLGIPTKLVPQQSAGAAGTRWTSVKGEVQVETFRVSAPGTTLAAVYEEQRKTPERKVSYGVVRPEFFVVSGTQDAKKFYMRGQGKDGEVRGFSIVYDASMAGTLDRVAIAMASAFEGFPGATVAAAPSPRRKVEYGSGVFIDAVGHALTTQHLTDGCETFALTGYGPAALVGQNKETGLALLRVYGVRTVQPVSVAEAAVADELTLIGVADPERQNGAAAVSTMKARVAAGAQSKMPELEPAPELGFAGAAAINTDGQLVGIVDVRVQVMAGPPANTLAHAAFIGANSIQPFLAANNVRPASGRAAVDAAKASVVRVICVRK